MESNICNKLVDYSFSSSESDEPPSKKKVGIVHLVVQSPKTAHQPEPEPEPVPEPDQQESPTSETVSEVVEDITEQPHEPEVILLSDSDTSDSETISLKTDTTLGKFPENSLIYSLT